MKHIKLLTLLSSSVLIGTIVPITTSCNKNKTISIEFEVKEEKTFHYIALIGQTQQLLDAGFTYGDSIDVYCSNGFSLKDIPIYSGYYAKHGDWQLCCYSKGPDMSLTRSNRDSWDMSGLKDGDSLKIVLNTRAKYLEVENNLNLVIKPEKLGKSDKVWVNFHDVSEIGTNNPLVKNKIYRGFSPLCNDIPQYSTRRETVNVLANEANINYDIEISHTKQQVEAYLDKAGTELDWIRNLYNTDNMLCLAMGVNPMQQEYRDQVKTVVSTLLTQLNAGNKVYIHCKEGKDRTGFIFLVLEAFAGCNEEITEKDFMSTFVNLFDVKEDSKQYGYIKAQYYESFKGDLYEIHPEYKDDLAKASQAFLKDCGFSDTELTNLKTALTQH